MSPAIAPSASILPVLLVLSAASAAAIAEEPSTPGTLEGRGPDGTLLEMPLRHTRASIEVSAFVARITVEQTFANPFAEPIEAVYRFPLGDRAAVDDFEMVVGDRTIRGKIRRRDEARRIYETARAAGHRAALLEQERPNIFTQSVANLEPGHEITVRIRAVETLAYDSGVYQLTFPLVVGPRHVPGSSPSATAARSPAATPNTMRIGEGRPAPGVPDAARLASPTIRPGFRSGHDVDVRVTLDAGVPIGRLTSPSHRIEIERPGPSAARVRLQSGDRIPNKDFVLRWDVSSDTPAVGLLAHREGVDGFFTLLVQPRGTTTPLQAVPKEIVLVLDASGSMAGPPLRGSRRFVRHALRTLGPRDTFHLVRFAGSAETFSPEPLPRSDAAIERALDWVAELRGRGGTEMLAGFRAAIERAPDPDRVRMVIFLTDGYIGNEQQILDAVAEVVGEARIFTLGIGSSVNHYLLDRMAALGGGAYQFIRPSEPLMPAVDRFARWVTRPALTDLEIDWGALPVLDLFPERPRDLYSGQTLTVIGRYAGAASGTVTVRGRLGGAYWEQAVEVRLPESEPTHAPLAALWARQRIADLMLRSSREIDASLRAEVTALALEYRLMGAFTSFVAVDDSEVVHPGGAPRTVQQALPLPEGATFEPVFGPAGPPGLRSLEGPEDETSTTERRTRAPGDRQAATRETATARPGSGPGGGIAVRVVDALGPLPGASVTVGNEDDRFRTTHRVCDRHGVVVFRGLPQGEAYFLEVSFPGFGSRRATDLTVRDGVLEQLVFQLSEELTEQVKVVAEREVVDLGPRGRRSAVARNVSTTYATTDLVDDLPVPGRFYQNVVRLAPGVQDPDGAGAPDVHGGLARDYATLVSGVSNVDPLTSGGATRPSPNSVEEMEVVVAAAGPEFGRAQSGFASVIQVPDRKAARRRARSPSPAPAPRESTGTENADASSGSGSVAGADGEEPARAQAPGTVRALGRHRTDPRTTAHVKESALRVLADLAEDGALTAAEGRPSLAALLGAQRPDGSLTDDVVVHAVATWALLEARAVLPDDPWLESAARKARGLLDTLARPDGWPARTWIVDPVDFEATLWARLVLGGSGTNGESGAIIPPDQASDSYRILHRARAAARSGAPLVDAPDGRHPFDRLVRAIARGHLRHGG